MNNNSENEVKTTISGVAKDRLDIPSAAHLDAKAQFEAWAMEDGTYDLRPYNWKVLSVGGVPYEGYQRPYKTDRTLYAYEGFCGALAAINTQGSDAA